MGLFEHLLWKISEKNLHVSSGICAYVCDFWRDDRSLGLMNVFLFQVKTFTKNTIRVDSSGGPGRSRMKKRQIVMKLAKK